MALKPDLDALQRSVRALTRSRTAGLLAVLLCASTLILVVSTRRPHSARGGAPLPLRSSAVTTLAGAPEQAPSAGGEIVPAQQRRLAPQVGHALIRYFQPQSAKPPHGSFVEDAVDSTKLFWFRLRECETERKCPYWPWWRKANVNVLVVPDDFVVGIMEPNNVCHGLLRVSPDSDYSLACRGPRVRVVSAPSGWSGRGPLPRTEWLAAEWNPTDEDRRR